VDLHKRAARQGPGGDAETALAMGLAGLEGAGPTRIADIGCGTGASTLVLARMPGARITAVDLFPEFLQVLEERAAELGLSARVSTRACSMEALTFEDGAYDVLWSEGAIYNIGFEKGIRAWRRYLKPGGLLVASEITWTTASRPAEIQAYWEREYPEIDRASAKMRVLEHHGYAPVGYLVLPEHCWLDNYYAPLETELADFLERNGHSEEARAIVDAERQEIALYRKYKHYYSYGMYVARKLD
jgi:SAM-dependent methyltransferase